MAFAREIIKKVLENVRFRVPTTEEKNSYYTQIGNTLVRISNHCTRLYVWDDMLEKNPKWKGLPIVSIVFEDTEDTFNEAECLTLKRFRMKPIKANEYVYRLQGNPQLITPQDVRLIIQSMKKISNGQYTDMTNKCSGPELRVSVNPQDNNQLNCNLNMNKKQIRLTESDLKQIVKESVNKILNELYMDGNVEQIDLDGSVSTNDGENGEIYATNLWFENNTIVVRWVDNNGADSTSDLLEDNPTLIWEILKSIKN